MVSEFIRYRIEGLRADHSGRYTTCEGLYLFVNVEEEGVGTPSPHEHDGKDRDVVEVYGAIGVGANFVGGKT